MEEASLGPTSPKRKCTQKDVFKPQFAKTVRKFDLPQQYPGMMCLLPNKIVETQSNLCDNTISGVPLTSQIIKLQKLRILSRHGRDLGEFNVELRDDEAKGKTIMLTKSPKKIDPVVDFLYNSGESCPAISENNNQQNRHPPKMMNIDLSCVKTPVNVTNIYKTDKINVVKYQQSLLLPNKFRNSSNVDNGSNAENKNVQASNNDAEIVERRRIIETSYKPGKLYPRILSKSKNFNKLNVDSNVTFLTTPGIDKISTRKQWRSKKNLSKSNKFNKSNNSENKIKANNNSIIDNNAEINTGTNLTNETTTCSTYLNNKEYALPNKKNSVNTCLKIQDDRSVKKNNNNEVLTKSSSYKDDIKSVSAANCKNLVVRLTNCMKTPGNTVIQNKKRRISKVKTIQAIESSRNEPSDAQGCSQDGKTTTESNSLETEKSLDKPRIPNETNMSLLKSLSNKQNNIMTIIPNIETVLLNQSADFPSNASVSSTSKTTPATSTHQRDNITRTCNRNTTVSSTSNENVINAADGGHTQDRSKIDSCSIVSAELTPESQRTVNVTTDTNTKSSNVQSKDLSNKFDIIKKAMDSVKDSKLRERALEALADCGIGIKRHVPMRPSEQHVTVHNSQVQTMVFGLLDPTSFILINKDIESLCRINQITLYDVPKEKKKEEQQEPSSEHAQEDTFDIDNFINEFIKGLEDDSDVSKINETLSISTLRHKNILCHLERDFQSVKRYDQNGRLNIHNAVLSNNVRLVQRYLLVLRRCKESVDMPTDTGMTSLELAIKYDVCKEIVELLLDAGAQPVVPIYLHESALIIASKQSSPLLPMLVNRISNRKLLDHIDSEGYAALHYCSIYGNLQGVKTLVSAGATIDLQDKKSGRTSLFHALDNSHRSVAEALLKAGAKAHIANYAGQIPVISMPSTSATETLPLQI